MRSQNAVRIVSTFSLLVVFAFQAFAGPYTEFAARLRKEKPGSDLWWTSKVSSQLKDADLKVALDTYLANKSESKSEDFEKLRSLAEGLAASEGVSKSSDAASKVQKIKSSTIFRDAGSAEGSSWLRNALDRLKFKTPDTPKLDPKLGNGATISQFFIWLAWLLLGGAVVAFLVFAARHIKWRGGLRKKATALLEEDEPDRTVDEWLALADRQAA